MDQYNSTQLEGPVSLFKRSWQLFRLQWQFLVPLFIFPSVLMYAGSLVAAAKNPILDILAFVAAIAGVILSIALRTAGISAINRLTKDPQSKISLAAQYRAGFSFFWSFIWIAILACLIFAGATILFVVPAVIIGIYTLFYSFTLVLDGKKGLASFLESYTLVKGRWWDVVVRLFFMALVFFVSYLIVAGVVFLIGGTVGDGKEIGTGILNLIFGAILGPISTAYLYHLYGSLKSTRTHEMIAPDAFKKWLVAFLIIGILVLLAGLSLIPILLLSAR